MYAIIEDSGSQFKVSEGDVIQVDLRQLPEDSASIEFDRVLLVGDDGKKKPKIGTPLVKGAAVTADVLGEERGDKQVTVKLRRRKNSRRKSSHRQRYLRVKITDIKA